ncbi:DUF4238 domain-containing protein [Rhodococcus qingshengii]|uniref:DUF4238 domain-containing protein n=1 Tax=Rhodococcus qingshengii TaxID=334542 RepID=UPI0037C811AB
MAQTLSSSAIGSANKWLSDAEIERSKERTRNNSQRTRIHHFDPQMYLRRWACGPVSPLVRFTEIATGRSDLDLPEAITNDEFFYQIIGDDIDPDVEPDLWFETHMSRIEDAAARWLRSLDHRAAGKITDPNLSGNLAVFVGLQSQRTPRARAGNLDISSARDRFNVREALDHPVILPILCRETGIDYTPARHHQIIDEIMLKPEYTGPKAAAIETSLNVWKNHITPFLAQRTWWLVTSEQPLLTCDEPVVLIGWPGQQRHPAPGFATAALVMFPIGPHRLLLATPESLRLRPPFTLSSEETRAVNLEISYNAIEFTYEEPSSDISAHMTLPPLPPFDRSTATNFWEALRPPPGRWAGLNAPEWPLQRWTASTP